MGGGIVRVSGVAPLNLPNAHEKELESLKVFGKCELSGTPSPDNPVDIICNNGIIKPYLNAEGSSTQDGTPSPDNPVEIQNYTQGNMVLRGVGDYKDIYNSSAKSITRKIGTIILTGEEDWVRNVTSQNIVRSYTILPDAYTKTSGRTSVICTHYHNIGNIFTNEVNGIFLGNDGKLWIVNSDDPAYTLKMFTDFVKEQYQNGTPVVAYYPLATETTETWNDVVYTEGTQEIITVGNSSATAEYLLNTTTTNLNFIDTQDILNGTITRKIGIYVFDGSEAIIKSSAPPCLSYSKTLLGSNSTVLPDGTAVERLKCTHYPSSNTSIYVDTLWIGNANINFNSLARFPEITDFKQFLADQYNTGTPVIVVFPLAEPTTEQVSPQPMSTIEGDNILEISGSLPDLEAEVEYWEKT